MTKKSNKDSKKSITIPIPNKQSLPLVLFILLIIAVFFIGRLSGELNSIKGTKSANTTNTTNTNNQAGTIQGTTQNQPQNPNTQPGQPVSVSVDDDPVLGDASAPVTMIEFSDYECPYCKQFWQNTFSKIKEEYIDTGKVKLVYRDLPLPFHDPMATKEAVAANCAREQQGDEIYFSYHDEIFTRTTSNGNGLSEEDLSTIAQDLGLNSSSFQECLDSDKYTEEITKDKTDAQQALATGTPTLFIGKSTGDGVIQGEKIVGAQPFSAFQPVIEKYLN